MAKHSAGLLLYRVHSGELEVLIVHPGGPFWAKKDDGVWSLPKGEYEPECDDAQATARREFEEELGHVAPDGELLDLGETRLKSGKRIVAWAVAGDLDPATVVSNTFEMQWPPRSGRMATFPEVDRAMWADPQTAAIKLNPAQVIFVERLLELRVDQV